MSEDLKLPYWVQTYASGDLQNSNWFSDAVHMDQEPRSSGYPENRLEVKECID